MSDMGETAVDIWAVANQTALSQMRNRQENTSNSERAIRPGLFGSLFAKLDVLAAKLTRKETANASGWRVDTGEDISTAAGNVWVQNVDVAGLLRGAKAQAAFDARLAVDKDATIAQADRPQAVVDQYLANLALVESQVQQASVRDSVEK